MAKTANYGWQLVDPNSQPDGPAQINALANSADADLHTLAATVTGGKVGGGSAQTTGISITNANGWGGGITVDYRIRNGWINLTITASRGTGTAVLTGPADSNLSPNNLVLTMNDHQPERNQWGSYGAVGAGGECLLDPNGNLYLVSLASTATIGPGDTIRATFTYPV